MAVAIAIIIILVVAVAHDDRARGEPSARRRRARCRARRSSATTSDADAGANRSRRRPSSRRPAANAPTTPAPRTRTCPRRAGAARSSSTNRSTRKSSASPAGSSSTAGSSASVGFSVAGLRRRVPRRSCGRTGSAGFGGKINVGQDQRHHRLHPDEAGAVLRARSARVRRCSTRRATSPPRRRSTARSPTPAWRRASSPLYQRCVHLGCRVPWCQTLAVVRVPVPRLEVQPRRREEGRSRARVVSTASRSPCRGGQMTIDTGDIEIGPPIGTNTTGQQQEGPLCV